MRLQGNDTKWKRETAKENEKCQNAHETQGGGTSRKENTAAAERDRSPEFYLLKNKSYYDTLTNHKDAFSYVLFRNLIIK